MLNTRARLISLEMDQARIDASRSMHEREVIDVALGIGPEFAQAVSWGMQAQRMIDDMAIKELQDAQAQVWDRIAREVSNANHSH